MSDDEQVPNCSNCGRQIVPFGRMRHSFVDADFQPICLDCAKRLIPEIVAEAEEMDSEWGAGDAEDE